MGPPGWNFNQASAFKTMLSRMNTCNPSAIKPSISRLENILSFREAATALGFEDAMVAMIQLPRDG